MRTARRRYLVFRIHSGATLSRKDASELLKEVSQNEALSITLLVYVPDIMEGIIRCDHRDIEKVRQMLGGPLNGNVITTLRTSGTIKTLRKAFPELSDSRKKRNKS